MFQETKRAKLSEKQTFLTRWYAHVRCVSGGKKCSFFGKFGVLCLLETRVLRFSFFLLPSLHLCIMNIVAIVLDSTRVLNKHFFIRQFFYNVNQWTWITHFVSTFQLLQNTGKRWNKWEHQKRSSRGVL